MPYIPQSNPYVTSNVNPSTSRASGSPSPVSIHALDETFNSKIKTASMTTKAVQLANQTVSKITKEFADSIQQDTDIKLLNKYEIEKAEFQANMQKQIAENPDPKKWTDTFKTGYLEFSNKVNEQYAGQLSKKAGDKLMYDMTGIYTQGLKHWTGQSIRQTRADAIESSNATLKTIVNSDMDLTNKSASINNVLTNLNGHGFITDEQMGVMQEGLYKEAKMNDYIKRIQSNPSFDGWKDDPMMGKVEQKVLKDTQRQRQSEIERQAEKSRIETYRKAQDEIADPKFVRYGSQEDVAQKYPNLPTRDQKKIFDTSESIYKMKSTNKLIDERGTPQYFDSLYAKTIKIDSKNLVDYKDVYDGLYKAPESVKKIINDLITDKTSSSSPIQKIPIQLKDAYNNIHTQILNEIKDYQYVESTDKKRFNDFLSPNVKGEWTDNSKFNIFSPNDQYYNPTTGKPFSDEEVQTLANNRNANFYKYLNDIRSLALEDGMTIEKFTDKSHDLYVRYKTNQTLERINSKKAETTTPAFYVNYKGQTKAITTDKLSGLSEKQRQKLYKMRVK